MPIAHNRAVRSLADVLHLARQQGGFVATKQLYALGWNKAAIRRRLQRGYLVRAGVGLLALPGVPDDRRSLLAGAVLTLPGAVVSHWSAVSEHGKADVPFHTATVTVPLRTTHTFPSVEVRESTDLTKEQTTIVDGLPVTSPARTVIDLAADLTLSRLAILVDQWLAVEMFAFIELADLHRQLARKGKPGITKLRKILDERGPGYQAPVSELERAALRLFKKWGLPEPVLQFSAPWWTPTPERVDFAYPELKLVIEFDSRRWHGRYLDFEKDRQRDNRAQLAGYRILRFTWEDVMKRPEYVASTVLAALAA